MALCRWLYLGQRMMLDRKIGHGISYLLQVADAVIRWVDRDSNPGPAD